MSTDDHDIEEMDLSGFQVVRREFFAHIQEPSIVFNQGKIGVNTACVRKIPETDYIQILVNREKKLMVIRPCHEYEIHSFLWCKVKNEKKYPRVVTGKLFFMKICALMNWNPENRYKIMGKMVRSGGQDLFLFNLMDFEMYKRIVDEGEKPKTSRTPLFQGDWRDQFGIPFEDSAKALQVNIFDGYAVYSIKDRTPGSEAVPVLHPADDSSPGQGEEEGDEL